MFVVDKEALEVFDEMSDLDCVNYTSVKLAISHKNIFLDFEFTLFICFKFRSTIKLSFA